jgi:uncharacterized protein YecE (DUF72 family)
MSVSAAGPTSLGAGCSTPRGLPHARELAYAAEHLTAIEINGTFYRTQTPATFRKWTADVPDGFMFSLKGPRYAVNRRVLAEAGDSIKRFLDSGVTELGGRLGPLLWQFAPHKKFDEARFSKFLELLPANFDGRALRHVVEVRNDSFKTPVFIALLRKFGIAVVYAEHDTYAEIADITANFVYARLQKGDEKLKRGYPPNALDAWARCAQVWAQGGEPKDLPRVPTKSAAKKTRDVFVYFNTSTTVQMMFERSPKYRRLMPSHGLPAILPSGSTACASMRDSTCMP